MKKKSRLIFVTIIAVILVIVIFLFFKLKADKPELILNDYISKINSASYEEMYDMLDDESKNSISKEDFVNRNKNIYQGIDMTNMKIDIF